MIPSFLTSDNNEAIQIGRSEIRRINICRNVSRASASKEAPPLFLVSDMNCAHVHFSGIKTDSAIVRSRLCAAICLFTNFRHSLPIQSLAFNFSASLKALWTYAFLPFFVRIQYLSTLGASPPAPLLFKAKIRIFSLKKDATYQKNFHSTCLKIYFAARLPAAARTTYVLLHCGLA